MIPQPARRRTIGLAVGSLWLVAISAAFAVWALIAIGTPLASRALAGTVAVVLASVVFGTIVIRTAQRMPDEKTMVQDRRLGRRFAWIVGAEVAAFGVVNTWAALSDNLALIPSLDLIIVGLHFFPLAQLFRVPRYHLMAIAFCAIPILTLVWLPRASLIGQAESWYVLPSLGCGLVALMTATASLREAWQLAIGSRRAVS